MSVGKRRTGRKWENANVFRTSDENRKKKGESMGKVRPPSIEKNL